MLLMLIICHVRLLSLTVLVKALMIDDNCNSDVDFISNVPLSLSLVKALILALKEPLRLMSALMTHLMTTLIMTTMMTFICPSSERQAAEPCLPIISQLNSGSGLVGDPD